MTVTLADIEAARRVIAGHVLRTPMLPAPRLSALTGAEVFVKYENLQVTNSFKERGARAKLASLSAAERARGVIAMSAGNHAQAVAYHAASLGIAATIVMPVTTPFVKVAATKAHGAEVLLDGETISEAQARAEAEARERGLIWVHPYDDPHVIAGQGTVALEMLEEVPDLDVLVIPIGGGGLIAGIATAAKAHQARDRDRRRGIGALSVDVERHPRRKPAERRRDACRRHRGEERRRADAADRARAGQRHRAGRRGAHRARGERLSHVAEGDGGGRGRRGACRDAGGAARFAGKRVGLVLCGGNIDPRILASIMVRELERDNRIVSFRLTIADRPGLLGPDRDDARPARRQHPRGRSPAAVPRRAGQGRAARRHGRDPRRRACGGNSRGAQG